MKSMVARAGPAQGNAFAMSGISGQSSTLSSLGGTPNIARMTLVYSAVKSITAAAGVVQDQVFSGNGCFDPDITGAGAQPANYDDWSALYGRYRVRASRIRVGLISNGTTTGTGVFYLGLAARHVTTAVTTPSGFDSAICLPFSQWHPVGTSVGSIPTYSAAYSTAQVLGYRESAIEDDDTLQALTSANPNHQWYWHIMVRVSDDSSTGAGTFYTRIEYDVEFFDRLDTLIDLEHKVSLDIKRLLAKKLREEKSGIRSKVSSQTLLELAHEYDENVLIPEDTKLESALRPPEVGSLQPRPSASTLVNGGGRLDTSLPGSRAIPRSKVVTQTELY